LQPFGGNHWDSVYFKYNLVKPVDSSERTVEALKDKFKKLAGSQKPTGN